MKKKYRVWFNQINQVVYDVKGETPLKALNKAKAEWKADHPVPDWYMEDESGAEIK